MEVVTICSIIALLLTYLESSSILKNGMKIGFIIVTTLAVIHYDYGNDYIPYLNEYLRIYDSKFYWKSIIEGEDFRDPGWAIIYHVFGIFGRNGFYILVAVLSIVQNVIFYKLIVRYVDKSWWPMAVFIYLFNTTFYILNFSMLRQGLVIAIFFALWPMIEHRRWLPSLIIIFLTTLIHGSALILLPFAFFGYIPARKGSIYAIILLSLLIFFFLSANAIGNVIGFMFESSERLSEYSHYRLDEKSATYGIGYLLNQIPFIASLVYIVRTNKPQMRQLVMLSCISFVIAPFFQVIPLIVRVQFYFAVFSIITIPIVYSNIKSKIIKYSISTLYVCILFFNYLKFFEDPIWRDAYDSFDTIFSVL